MIKTQDSNVMTVNAAGAVSGTCGGHIPFEKAFQNISPPDQPVECYSCGYRKESRICPYCGNR